MILPPLTNSLTKNRRWRDGGRGGSCPVDDGEMAAEVIRVLSSMLAAVLSKTRRRRGTADGEREEWSER